MVYMVRIGMSVNDIRFNILLMRMSCHLWNSWNERITILAQDGNNVNNFFFISNANILKETYNFNINCIALLKFGVFAHIFFNRLGNYASFILKGREYSMCRVTLCYTNNKFHQKREKKNSALTNSFTILRRQCVVEVKFNTHKIKYTILQDNKKRIIFNIRRVLFCIHLRAPSWLFSIIGG